MLKLPPPSHDINGLGGSPLTNCLPICEIKLVAPDIDSLLGVTNSSRGYILAISKYRFS
jgi:hypothetical protein